MNPEYKNWLLVEEAPVATLTLNRPQTQNNLNPEALYELREISDYLGTLKDIWVVILRGQGRHFSTGMDVDTIKSRMDLPEEENRAFLAGLQRCLDAFEALEKPTIARLHGFCVGGGLILALCCDFRIASQHTVFYMPEVRLGIGVIMGTQRITRVAGLAATKELVLLGRRLNAQNAYSHSLVHKVVPEKDLDDTVAALANRFRALPPRTIGIAKRIINAGQDLPLRASQDLEIDAQAELLGSPDLHEALESYLEKRPPTFQGK